MGHESAGEVIAVGDLVTTHKVGDRVAGASNRFQTIALRMAGG
jgi:threonine dehydrogenase-like Zn-dependent dehydrogenase